MSKIKGKEGEESGSAADAVAAQACGPQVRSPARAYEKLGTHL